MGEVAVLGYHPLSRHEDDIGSRFTYPQCKCEIVVSFAIELEVFFLIKELLALGLIEARKNKRNVEELITQAPG